MRWWLTRLALPLLLLLFLGLAGIQATVIPLSKAPDEYVHFRYGRFIAENGRLPLTVAERQTVGYKADQPPLYYGLVALATGWIDMTGPVLKMTWDSPRRKLADIVLPRGMIVRTDDESFPFQGVVLAWLAGRWLSAILSALTVGLVFITARRLFPERFPLAIISAATVAFTPAYLFVGSVLNDDNLIGLISALFFLGVIRLLQGPASLWLFAGLGLLLGVAVTTKYSSVVLPLELIAITLLVGRYRKWSLREVVSRLTFCFGLAVLAAGWWFAFVGWYFNEIDKFGWLLGVIRPILVGDASDPTVARLSSLVGEESLAAQSSQGPIWSWVATFFMRFWTVPVFGREPLYPPLYTGLLMLFLCLLSGYGLWRLWREGSDRQRTVLSLLFLHLLIFLILPLVRYAVSGKIHDTAQARHLLFPAAPAFGILLAWGMSRLAADWRLHWLNAAWPVALFGLSLLQLYYFNQAFPPRLPLRTVPELIRPPAHPMSVGYEDGIELLGYDDRLQSDPPALAITLYWKSLDYAHEDYLPELSLIDSQGRLVAQTVAHPAHGRYPTRAWDPGDVIYQTIVLPLVGVESGRYKLQLRLRGWDEPLAVNGSDTLLLTELALPVAVSEEVSFQAVLSGAVHIPYSLWQNGRLAGPQPVYRYLADIPITIAPLPAGIRAELRLIGPDGRIRRPVAGAGQMQTFVVEYDWPSGPYKMLTEMWEDGWPVPEQRPDEPILTVENRAVSFEIPPIGHRLEANFADKIMLLGYDLPTRRIEPAEGVSLLLYWQALARMRHSYVIFARLLDADQQVWGGYDRLPQETYSTILWVPGEVVADGFILPIDPDTPNGIYEVVLGLYREDDPAATSLPLAEAGRPTAKTSIRIGPLKVGRSPSEAILTDAAPQIVRNDQFGQPPLIALIGYDLLVEADRLQLRLYWRSEALTDIHYARFVHLRNAQGNTTLQHDAPPGDSRYLTSLWDPGQVIVDPVVLELPPDLPSGSYTIAVGLYNPIGGERLAGPELPDGSLNLTALEIGD